MLGALKKRIGDFVKDESNSSAHAIAFGFSLGSFIAILPTPGFSVLIGLFLLLVLRNVNRFALLGGLALWNPIVVSPIYILSYSLGNLLFGAEPVVSYDVVFLDQVFSFTRRFLLGNLIFALSISVVSYFVVSWFITRRSK